MPALSLADWLRACDDDALTTLLRLRRDLATPPPRDADVLATRAGTPGSVARACADLDTRTLAVLSTLLLAGADTEPVPARQLAELTGIDPAQDLEALRTRALAWGGDEELLIPHATHEVLGPYPAGLGASVPALRERDLDEALAELGEDERELVNTLAEGPPVGRTRDASSTVPLAEAQTPVQRLLARGLLRRKDAETVELPRELALAVRGGRVFAQSTLTEPSPRTVSLEHGAAEATAAGEAMEFVRNTESLLRSLSTQPAAVLKSGGLGIRELRRLAREFDLPENVTVLLLESAAGAGLLAAENTADPEWVPTTLLDSWLASPTSVRWTMLAEAWLRLPRRPSLAGSRDHKDKTLAPLSTELHHPAAPALRSRVLGTLAEFPEDTGLADTEELVALLGWRAPRRVGTPAGAEARAGIAEAAKIGLIARGAVPAPARALLADERAAAIEAMAAALPQPVDHVLVQADLTVIAPGPLEPDLGAEIDAVADVESAGQATVYRLSENSVRRALDSGRTADELHELFAKRSATPVPQGLTYLINDVARRHGRLRGGAASSFLRCDDEVLLTEVMAKQTDGEWDLRQIAPTILVSSLPLAELLDKLRAAGFTPVAEGPDGRVMDLRRGQGRRIQAPARSAATPPEQHESPTSEQAAVVVARLRAGEQAARSRHGTTVRPAPGGGGADTSATLALLSRASREGREVWIGLVDSHGVADQRVVTPARVGGGVLEGANNERYPLHRITSAALVED